MHMPPVQRAPLAVQNVLPPPPPPASVAGAAPQQIWPTSPQRVPAVSVQEPALHVPITLLATHVWPEPTQMRVLPPPASFAMGMQQPPPLQMLPVQQIWPGPPQSALEPEPPVPVAGRPPLPVTTVVVLLLLPQAESPSAASTTIIAAVTTPVIVC